MTTSSLSHHGRHTPPRPGSGPCAPGPDRRPELGGIARPAAGPVSALFRLIVGERSWRRRRNRCLAAGTEPSWQPVTVESVLACLNREQIRATYAAVAAVVGICPPAMGRALGDRRPEASWVVNAVSGMPTGYKPHQIHPEILRTPEIIRNPQELSERMKGAARWIRDRYRAEPDADHRRLARHRRRSQPAHRRQTA